MLNKGFKDSCREKLKQTRLSTIYGLYLHECLLYLFKNKSYFLVGNTNTLHNTRTAEIYYPIHRLSLTEKNPFYMCIRIFNKLPNHLKSVVNLREFKTKTKNILIELEHCLEEFFSM